MIYRSTGQRQQYECHGTGGRETPRADSLGPNNPQRQANRRAACGQGKYTSLGCGVTNTRTQARKKEEQEPRPHRYRARSSCCKPANFVGSIVKLHPDRNSALRCCRES